MCATHRWNEFYKIYNQIGDTFFSFFLRKSKKQIYSGKEFIYESQQQQEKIEKRIPGVHNFSSVGRAVDIVVGVVFVVPQCLSNYFP